MCNNCGSARLTGRFRCSGFSIAACDSCGLLQVHPQPGRDELAAHYREDEHWGGEPQRRTEDRSRLLYRQVLGELPRAGNVLDVGCSFGVFLEELRAAGHAATGIELSERAAARARERGFEVHDEPVGPELPTAGFSAVTMLNVVEHLRDPLVTCKEIWRILRPGGTLIVVTPNTGFALPAVTVETRLRGDRDITATWARRISQLHPPDHLFFYTRRTLEDLLWHAGFEGLAVHNAAPIINEGRLRTMMKFLLYGTARVIDAVSAHRWLAGHSMLAVARKPDDV